MWCVCCFGVGGFLLLLFILLLWFFVFVCLLLLLLFWLFAAVVLIDGIHYRRLKQHQQNAVEESSRHDGYRTKC